MPLPTPQHADRVKVSESLAEHHGHRTTRNASRTASGRPHGKPREHGVDRERFVEFHMRVSRAMGVCVKPSEINSSTPFQGMPTSHTHTHARTPSTTDADTENNRFVFDYETAREAALRDWERVRAMQRGPHTHSPTHPHTHTAEPETDTCVLGYTGFLTFLFDLCDSWVSGFHTRDYVTFLRTLFNCVFTWTSANSSRFAASSSASQASAGPQNHTTTPSFPSSSSSSSSSSFLSLFSNSNARENRTLYSSYTWRLFHHVLDFKTVLKNGDQHVTMHPQVRPHSYVCVCVCVECFR
jgi:hypothetical protein